MKRRRLACLLLAVVAIVACAAWVAVDYRTHPRAVNGPMVQNVTQNGFTVIWQAHPDRELLLRVRRQAGQVVAEVPGVREGELWRARVDALEQGMRYRYTLVDPATGSAATAEYAVGTAPGDGAALRFLAIGDTGDGSRRQDAVAARLGAWRPDLVIHTGDIVYSRGEWANYASRFFAPYRALLGEVPFYPCLGNHDIRDRSGAETPALAVFDLPRNGPPGDVPETQYWFDWGAVRFVAVNSNLHSHELARITAPWLESVLSSAGDRWKIVYWHEPLFTHGDGNQPSEKMREIIPVIDRHRVDLVLHGHNHMYERTRPIFEEKAAADGNGTTYVVTGAGGARLNEELPDPPGYIVTSDGNTPSFTVVDVSPALINVRQVAADGRILDDFGITRRAETPPTTRPAVSPTL